MAFVVDASEAEVLVALKKGGSWSTVGKDYLTRKIEPTTNFGWFDDSTADYEVARTVYHEFGHALGWDSDMVDRHTETRHSSHNFTEIIQYHFPQERTLNKRFVRPNNRD
ncbi:hypothetical protein F4803DRAFT_577572 [Xylaria telfairii]|nr:hypothetical protein F4803DRAFT_577572 [Xylaria telfairii]